MLDSELKSKINLLWNKFWSGGISNPLQAIEQMSYLIFMKRLEDEDIAKDYDETVIIKAPLVGTYYTALKPDADPFLSEGDIIIFPSFIRHRVLKQETDEVRITSSFNINTINGSARRVFCP